MNKIYILFVLFFSISSYSQTISGSVFDEAKDPIPGASVYLDGTTIGTVTDSNGKYSLDINQNSNVSLIVQALGYETIIIDNPLKKNSLNWYLIPKQTQLREVIIKKEYFTRKQKLDVFKEQLLGLSKAGKSCSIDNEEEIILDYDYTTNVLSATSINPIKVKNPYLGYDVDFNLQEFYVKFYKRSVKSIDATESSFLGTTLYREVKNDSKVEKIRKDAYQQSAMNFFKILANNKWKEAKYTFYKGSFPANPEHFFTITQEGDFKKITVLYNDVKNHLLSNKTEFYAEYSLLNKKNQSKIMFYTNEFYVDKFGNNSNTGEIRFSGYLGTKRLGDLLPSNYLPLLNAN
jgi:hypothetical protein